MTLDRKTLAALVALAFAGCVDTVDTGAETHELEAQSASSVTADDFVGYWTNGYDTRAGAIGRMELAADGTYEARIASTSGSFRDETGTWTLSGRGTARTLRLASGAGTRVYGLRIVQFGDLVWPTNPSFNAEIRLVSPLSLRLFGSVDTDD